LFELRYLITVIAKLIAINAPKILFLIISQRGLKKWFFEKRSKKTFILYTKYDLSCKKANFTTLKEAILWKNQGNVFSRAL